MRLLVVGASGYLGSLLEPILSGMFEMVGTYANKPRAGLVHLDVCDEVKVRHILSMNWDLVLHLGGIVDAQACEDNPERAHQINVVGVRHVARHVQSKLIYVSSDNVFDRPGECSESTPPCPLNQYGILKLAAEEEVLQANDDHLVLRVPFLYGANSKTRQFLDRFRDPVTKVPDPIVCNPLYVLDVAERLSDLYDITGVAHLGGSTTLTRVAFFQSVLDVLPFISSVIEPTPQKEFPIRRPASSVLVSERGIDPGRSIEKGLTALQHDVRSFVRW